MKHALFSKLRAQILGFENIPKLYENDRTLHPSLLVGNIEHKEDFMFLKGICLNKEKFVYLKEHIQNFVLKSHMKEVLWIILEF